MGDPFALFAADDGGLQEALRIVWPALYSVLARTDEPASERAIRCAAAKAHSIDTFRPAVGRLIFDGPPACAECVTKAARRPGGFPLTRKVVK
jgi:hypothetical protein